MIIQNSATQTETRWRELLVEMLEDKKFDEAKIFADRLRGEGIDFTSINSAAYNYIRGLITRGDERLSGILEKFSGNPYNWDLWIA